MRRLARLRLAPYVAYVLLFQTFNWLRAWSVGIDTELFLQASLEALLFIFVSFSLTFVAIVLTEAVALSGWRHFAASFFAIAAAIGVGLWCMVLVFGLNNPVMVRAQVIVSDEAFVWRNLWTYLGGAMLLVAYFAFREREQAAAKAAQDADTRRAQVERATTAARLKVMQARVEPELLFGALSDVRGLYLREPVAADALLDDLITYLRAALPQMRGDASTLGRESALAVAYAKVLPAARRGELTAEFTIPELAQELPFPPMVLLPLVRSAAESTASTIAIEVEGEPATGVIVRVESQRPVVWDEARLESARSALSHGLGAGATLHADGARVVVRW